MNRFPEKSFPARRPQRPRESHENLVWGTSQLRSDVSSVLPACETMIGGIAIDPDPVIEATAGGVTILYTPTDEAEPGCG